MTERFMRREATEGAGRAEGAGSRRDDAHRRRSLRGRVSRLAPGDDRSPAKRSIRDPGLEGFLEVLDRERLGPVEVLLMLRVAASEATVVELAAALDRDPVAVRRAAAGLIGRGLLRQRPARRGLVLETMPSGVAALSRLAEPLDQSPPSHG